ncbi:MAG: hypothetical protein IJ480_03095 [Clostridia bacterium]|nr:hypothetical protein [Clostridia bacterium]
MKILHDIHTHNVFSACCGDKTASTAAYLEKEAALGMKLFGLSNHIWDERVPGASAWYRNQTILKAEEARATLEKADPSMKVLFGCETEYYACRDLLGMSPEGAVHFDYLLIPHSHLHMRNEVMADFPEILEARAKVRADLAQKMPYLPEKNLDAMAATLKEADLVKIFPELEIDVMAYTNRANLDTFRALLASREVEKLTGMLPVSIAHSFSPCGVPHAKKNEYLAGIRDEDAAECYRRAAKMGLYIELNVGAITEVSFDMDNHRLMDLYKIAKAEGCQFTFGTDSHSVEGLELIAHANQVADALGLEPGDLAEFVRCGADA